MTSSHVYERSLPIMAEYGHRPARHVQLVYDAFHVQLGVPEACVFFFCPLTEALFPNHHKPRRSREHVRDRNAMRTEVQMPRELHGMEAGGLRAPVIVFKDSVIRNGYNRCVIFPESERAYLCKGLSIPYNPAGEANVACETRWASWMSPPPPLCPP